MSVRSDSCRAHCLTSGWASTKVRVYWSAATRAVLRRLSLGGGRREASVRRASSDSLVIMAKKVVEVRECDRCGQEPAHQWTITGPEGTVRAIDLCDRHGAPVANAFALAQPVANR